QYDGQTLHISAANIVDTVAPYELVSRMRASFWVVAPLVARLGEAKVSMPGGCAIGTRPVDLLIMALERLGADIETDRGYVIARARNGLRGGNIKFPKVTVGGTHTALMAASLARGTSLIENAARQPEITETSFENRFMHVQGLVRLGAHIQLDGECATIEGVSTLKGAPVMATDLRASVSLVIAALAAEGETLVNRVYHLDRGFERLEDKLSACGAAIERISG